MIAAPVAAATRTVPITLSAKPVPQSAWNSADEIFNKHRWRGYRHHRDRIDGGDLLAGILVIGGIAAIRGEYRGRDLLSFRRLRRYFAGDCNDDCCAGRCGDPGGADHRST